MERRRSRIEAAYEGGLYDLAVFADKVGDIDKQLDSLRSQANCADSKRAERQQLRETLHTMADLAGHVRGWLVDYDAGEVNRVLSVLLDRIVVVGDSVELVEK